VPETARATFAQAALAHRSTGVRVAAVTLVGCDTPTAVEKLAPLLEDRDSAVRVAAASALAGCSAHDEVATLFVTALGRPEARDAGREELIALYRALGRLGTGVGFEWLVAKLIGGRRKLFKKPSEDDQLLAVQGLVAEGSNRAADVLEHASGNADHLRVGAAARAGARMLRSQQPPAAPMAQVAAA
jgi:HEAT repeat protein